MNYGFCIKSGKNLKSAEREILKTIPFHNIDYIYCENVERRGESRNLLCFQTKKAVKSEVLSACLSLWIIDNYEKQLMSELLYSDFMEFSCSEQKEILDIAQNKALYESRFYNINTLVKNLTKYFNTENTISIEGFLRFAASEYRTALEELLSEAIDDFIAEQEYNDFIELLCDYIETKPPIIDLLHITRDLRGNYKFYDFSKKPIAVSIDEEDLFNSLFSEEDKLMSILITLAPKRIIWHNENQIPNSNLKATIKNVFKNRFAECNECELCKKFFNPSN